MTSVVVIWDDGGMQRKPLGEYELFEKRSGRPRSWGASGEARAWFGGQVVDGLCSVLDEHLAATGRHSAAIGCVPWLTSEGVVDRPRLVRAPPAVGYRAWPADSGDRG
jgi:hypothetical protein